jgi:peptidoglycan-N-acetylglucosamine deacetylase
MSAMSGFVLLLLLTCPAYLQEQIPSPVSPAVSDLLHMLWSPLQLKGTAEDKLLIKPWHGKIQEPQETCPLAVQGPPMSLPQEKPVDRVLLPVGKKMLALTFDVCEGIGERSGYDGNIIDYLRDKQVPATFFLGGKWMQTHPERAMQLIADPLFEVGTHGWIHLDSRHISGLALRNELLWPLQQYQLLWCELARRALEKKLPPKAFARILASPRVFRFPYGIWTVEALNILTDWGIRPIQWDVVPGDPVNAFSAEVIAAAIVSRARPGSIIVCHANGKGLHTGAALPLFIPALQNKGFSFVTISRLLASGRPVP